MGWYQAVGRPAFLALPPEAAHRVANALLGLPLAWRHMGGVARRSVAGHHGRRDLAAQPDRAGGRLRQDLRTSGCARPPGVRLRRGRHDHASASARQPEAADRPVPAAPIHGERDGAAESGGRGGRREPRAEPADRPAVRERRRRGRRRMPTATAELLAPHADALELNASCPNVAWGRDRDNEAHLAEPAGCPVGHGRTSPVFVKLPPFAGGVEREVVLALAAIAAEHGAAGITCANTRPARGASPRRGLRRPVRPRPVRVDARDGGGRPRRHGAADPRVRRRRHRPGRACLPRGRRGHRADLHRARVRGARAWSAICARASPTGRVPVQARSTRVRRCPLPRPSSAVKMSASSDPGPARAEGVAWPRPRARPSGCALRSPTAWPSGWTAW